MQTQSQAAPSGKTSFVWGVDVNTRLCYTWFTLVVLVRLGTVMITSSPLGRQQFFFALRERIEQGRYPAGSWLPAERALAQEFGLDRSAVRFALLQLENEGLIVREAGRRPWVRGVSGAACQDKAQAEDEPSAQTRLRTIAAILPQHPLYPASQAIMYGINTVLRAEEAPFRLQVIDTHGGGESRETSREKQALESVAREKIAGVVIWHVGGEDTLPQLRQLERSQTPVVFVDRYPAPLACDFVGTDNQSGVETVVEYLRLLGHRRIAHLTTDEQTTAVLERLAAYTEAMTAAGAPPCPGWVFKVPHDGPVDMAPACDQYFACPEPPTAVLAMNDMLAHYFITECQKRGVDVPEGISVIGFDDLERYSPRPALLTTLHQAFDKMGRRAAALLLQRLAEPSSVWGPKRHILLPAPLVQRSTCRALGSKPGR